MEKNIPYKLVNAYESNIIEQVADCDVFMWHFDSRIPSDTIMARQLLFALQMAGKKVFPDFNTCWHFNDKVGQKYLLESIGAPLVTSYVYYSKTDAFSAISNIRFPIVFKLRVGAGASNVWLISSKPQAQKIVRKLFGKGFNQYNYLADFKDGWENYKSHKLSFKGLLFKLLQFAFPPQQSKLLSIERGYFYFQEFIPENTFDVRLIIIGGEKAYGMKRIVRKNDFRASGSSDFVYDGMPADVLSIGFQVAQRLGLQSVALDFIFENGSPLITEISCFFGTKGSAKCKGYWTPDFKWHEGGVNPYGWMISDLMKVEF